MKPRRAFVAALLVTVPVAAAPDDPAREDDADSVAALLADGVAHLVAGQEGDERREWPYEGVYRVRGRIPVGYRVGGTALGAMALSAAPGPADDAERRAAMDRAIAFLGAGPELPGMGHEIRGTYDVRGWGWAYGLMALVALDGADAVPAAHRESADRAIAFYIQGLERTAIPETGGWNYARRNGIAAPGPHAPFMTAPVLQALFAAAAAGHAVDTEVVERGLAALEAARAKSGAVAYAAQGERRSGDLVPGATGRMLATETTLMLAGRSDAARVRGAVDAFLVHWDELEVRRQQRGTHVKPYGVAPYYFFYAHHAAARAIELLPRGERAAYRHRLEAILRKVQDDDGTWNDRVFPRSALYGTSMTILALCMPHAPPPARWPAGS